LSGNQALSFFVEGRTEFGPYLLDMQPPSAAGRNACGRLIVILEHLRKRIYRRAGIAAPRGWQDCEP
jgi:hypothetical protein